MVTPSILRPKPPRRRRESNDHDRAETPLGRTRPTAESLECRATPGLERARRQTKQVWHDHPSLERDQGRPAFLTGLKLSLLLAVTAALVSSAAAVAAGIGVNDDAAKDPSTVGWFYPTLAAEGLTESTVSLRWDETEPTAIPDEAAVTRAIAAATANGATVELDLFPLHSMAFTDGAQCGSTNDPQSCGDTTQIQAFANWTAAVAAAFPTVHQYVVMNECNQPLFVNPQFDATGANQSAEICGRALAAAYDALKRASPQNFVWGVGLSPRGNDNPSAASNVSTSPVKFLGALGAWFKAFAAATGRTRPLMDGLDFHPYPIPQSLPFSTGYVGTTSATVSNLPRIYQAFYDGFNGSPQRTIGQQPGGGLPVSLNEVGIQTDSTGQPGYVGTETAANVAGGVLGQTATEAYQASWYLQMLQLVACDPNVREVNIYHLIDEAALSGWQSGLFYLDRMPKASAETVHDWLASTGGACQGVVHPWTPPGVAAATPAPGPPAGTSGPRIVVGSSGRLRIFDAATHTLRRVVAPFGTAYAGSISLGLGDANRDGVADIAAGQGPVVKVLNGKSGETLASYSTTFKAGVSVALGDVNGDGRADLVVGSGPGAPARVRVYDGKTHALLESLSPFGEFSGGVTVAAGDVNGDGKADVIVGTGPGAKAQIAVYSGATSTLLELLSPFSPSFTGGVSVAAGDLNGDGKADVVAGSGVGSASVIRVFSGATRSSLLSFAPFAATFTGGVNVSAAGGQIVAGTGAGGDSQVRVFDGKTGALVSTFLGATGSAAVTVTAAAS